MGEFGVPALLIMLAIIIILVGPARLAGLGQSLGNSIRSLRPDRRQREEQASSGDSQT